MNKSKHEFALFTAQELKIGKLGITDTGIIFRLQNVLRIASGDTVILFNGTVHAQATLVSCTKKEAVFSISELRTHNRLVPTIQWLLPMLEKDAFDAALYSLSALGATSIQPIITEKSRQKWGNEKELERARRIMIAAAEQAKQFVLPALYAAKRLNEVDTPLSAAKRIFFDPAGLPPVRMIQDIQDAQELVLCCGPEGDLTATEKEYLKAHGFQFYALTPTVLRACDAVLVAQGIVRALIS